jgi:hypothetical protein
MDDQVIVEINCRNCGEMLVIRCRQDKNKRREFFLVKCLVIYIYPDTVKLSIYAAA